MIIDFYREDEVMVDDGLQWRCENDGEQPRDKTDLRKIFFKFLLFFFFSQTFKFNSFSLHSMKTKIPLIQKLSLFSFKI